MNRRTFLAAAPIAALAVTAAAQTPGLTIGDEDGKLTLKPRPTPGAPPETTKAARKTQGPTEITAREGSLNNEKHQAVFTGEVIVKSPEFNITCDKLTVDLKQTKGKAPISPAEPRPIGADAPADPPPTKDDKAENDISSGIEKALAEGNVVIVQDKPNAKGQMQRYTAVAKRAVYDAKDGVLTLYGWPKVSKGITGNVTEQMISIEESCVMTLTRGGNISYKNGGAVTRLGSERAAQ